MPHTLRKRSYSVEYQHNRWACSAMSLEKGRRCLVFFRGLTRLRVPLGVRDSPQRVSPRNRMVQPWGGTTVLMVVAPSHTFLKVSPLRSTYRAEFKLVSPTFRFSDGSRRRIPVHTFHSRREPLYFSRSLGCFSLQRQRPCLNGSRKHDRHRAHSLRAMTDTRSTPFPWTFLFSLSSVSR